MTAVLCGLLLVLAGTGALLFLLLFDARHNQRELDDRLAAAEEHAVRLDTERRIERSISSRLSAENIALQTRVHELGADNAALRADLISGSRPLPHREPVPPAWVDQLIQIRDLPTPEDR
ncbi:MAG: hypothetical protein ABW000_07150 [Actinoplanes sp.]